MGFFDFSGIRDHFLNYGQKIDLAKEMLGTGFALESAGSLEAQKVGAELLQKFRHNLPGLEAEYATLFKSKANLATGRRKYVLIESLHETIDGLNTEDNQDCQKLVAIFTEAWKESDRSAFMSAYLGALMCDLGFTYRGHDVASNVSKEGWDQLFKHVKMAHEIFDYRRPRCDENPFWHRMYFKIGLADCSDADELETRFERALAFDTQDIEIYLDRAYQLMPRWHGSYEEIDEFARRSAARTSRERGDMMYAAIYDYLKSQEHPGDTEVDIDLLNRGFSDWMRTYNQQYTANVWASFAHILEDKKTFAYVVENHLTEIQPMAWLSVGQCAEALYGYAKQTRR